MLPALVRKLIFRVTLQGQRWILKGYKVGSYVGITISDLRTKKGEPPHFRDTVLAALRLLEATDPYRFARVRKRLTYIAREVLTEAGAAEYNHSTRKCSIDFQDPPSGSDSDYLRYLSGWYARIIVHEATHGVIQSRGIHYTPDQRVRIESICVAEEQRFLMLLTLTDPDLADRLYFEFDPAHWKEHWRRTPAEHFRIRLSRIFSAGGANGAE